MTYAATQLTILTPPLTHTVCRYTLLKQEFESKRFTPHASKSFTAGARARDRTVLQAASPNLSSSKTELAMSAACPSSPTSDGSSGPSSACDPKTVPMHASCPSSTARSLHDLKRGDHSVQLLTLLSDSELHRATLLEENHHLQEQLHALQAEASDAAASRDTERQAERRTRRQLEKHVRELDADQVCAWVSGAP